MERVTYQLRVTACYGKEARSDGFKLFAKTGEVPADVVATAEAWNQAVKQSSGTSATVLRRAGEAWWLLSAFWEPRWDSANRAITGVALGRLDRAPLPEHVAPLLSDYRSRCPKKLTEPLPRSAEAEAVPSGASSWEETARAALGLAVFGTGAVKPAEATTVLQRFPLAGLDWVASIEGALPGQLPAGRGLYLLAQPEQLEIQPGIGEVVAHMSQETFQGLDLPGLIAVEDKDSERLELVRAAIGARQGPFARLSEDALIWLEKHDASRDIAFLSVQRGQITPWLRRLPRAAPAQARLLKGRVEPRDSEAIRIALSRSDASDRFLAYHELFPGDAIPRLSLLDEPARDAWEALECTEGDGAIDRVSAEALLKVLAATRLRPRATLLGLARGAQGQHPRMCQWFQEELARQGLPVSLTAVLLGQAVPGGPVPPFPSKPLPPPASWLPGINGTAFLSCWEWLKASRWRNWWNEVVLCLVKAGLLEEPQRLLATALRSRAPGLLQAVGMPEVVQRWANPEEGDLEFPPASWPASANPLLRNLYRSNEVWGRLQVPSEQDWDRGLVWLANALGEEGEEVRELRRKLIAGEHVEADLLTNIAYLLPRPQLLGQVVVWVARPFDPDREDILEWLLGREALEGQCDWLRACCFDNSLRRLGPVPSVWGPRDLAALLPVLDPVRDVVREVFSWPTVQDERGEALLLDRLCKQFEDEGGRRNRPLPGPDAVQSAVRPEWVKRLAPLLGWSDPSSVLSSVP